MDESGAGKWMPDLYRQSDFVRVGKDRQRSPASLLVVDERLLQLTAGMVNGSQTAVSAASHLLTDPPQVCHKCVQSPVQARHAQQSVSVCFSNNLKGHQICGI